MKRAIDIVGSLVGLIITAVITPFVALAIRIESPDQSSLHRGVSAGMVVDLRFTSSVPCILMRKSVRRN